MDRDNEGDEYFPGWFNRCMYDLSEWIKGICERHDLDPVEMLASLLVFVCLMMAVFGVFVAVAGK